MIISGSKIGVFSVYFVVIEASMPKMRPINTPPNATTKNEAAPKTMSTGRILALPISDKPSNSR